MSKWRQNALAFICGIAATLTLAPFFIAPLIIVAYGGLYYLLQSATSAKRAFVLGWFWGWGFYITGLYWFCVALLTDPEKFAWLIPFALFGLTAVIALYAGVASVIYWCIRLRGIADIFIFASVWALVEYARGHLFTGFPWNLPGYAIAFSDASLQLASLFGAYGLSWVIVLLGALPAAIRLNYSRAKLVTLVAYSLFAVGCVWGALRLTTPDEQYVQGVNVRLVQANISQHHKWDPKRQFDGLRAHIELMQSPGLEKITHVVWPETAVPYVIQENSTLTRMLGESLPDSTVLITGGLHSEGQGASWKLWNSIVAINHEGDIIGKYDKHKLVPFGEFLPLRWLIPKAWQTPVGDKDFSAGSGVQTLNWQGLPLVSPLVCYEVIFPNLSVGANRPQFLLNLTNDAWFGLSTGPHQHFEMARMRAVEQGLPLVRVANTGISAIINGQGEIIKMLPLGQQGIIDGQIPLASKQLTLYARYGDGLLWLAAALSSLLIIRRKNSRLN